MGNCPSHSALISQKTHIGTHTLMDLLPTQIEWNSKSEQANRSERTKSRFLNPMGLVVIMILAAVFRLRNLSSLRLANHYYAAAVKSMLMSWHNFFFVAAEPGGSVSVDKPPVGLWLQAISARILGVSTIGLLLPQILAGLLSVWLVYHLVNRKFGAAVGLLAALALAITPVVIATDRNNTMDSTLVFTLLLAAWAFTKSTETSRLKFLMAGAVLMGIAFNIKMLEAYLPLPAFLGIYLLGAPEGLLRKIGKLSLTLVVILVISLSWSVAVDLIPANQRPYVGSSGDNSEISLIIGYNGIERLLGIFRGPSGDIGIHQSNISGSSPNGSSIPPEANFLPPDGVIPPDGIQTGAPHIPKQGGFLIGATPGRAISGTGKAGPLRLFIPPLSKEVSWWLPFGLFSLILLVVSGRFTWPIGGQHQAAVLWGGWLITAGIIFSGAGFFHEYYLSTLAPPLAALVGIGVIETWKLGKRCGWLGGISIILVTALTLLLQYTTARAFITDISWLPLVLGIFLLGVVLIVVANIISAPIRNRLAVTGYICFVATIMATPAVWSYLTNLYASDNLSLPSAYSGRNSASSNSGKIQVDTSLLDYLQANTQDVYYLLAVPSSMQGADYVLATGRPVLYLGGFNGEDEVLTPDYLAKLVTEGKLRFIAWNSGRGGGGPIGGQSLITGWVSSHCQVVQRFNSTTRNFIAPEGITAGTGSGVFPGGAQFTAIFDCGK
jgi:4-amino-4-deoxy-L-arabinose transferase-like glycosyltransferase